MKLSDSDSFDDERCLILWLIFRRCDALDLCGSWAHFCPSMSLCERGGGVVWFQVIPFKVKGRKQSPKSVKVKIVLIRSTFQVTGAGLGFTFSGFLYIYILCPHPREYQGQESLVAVDGDRDPAEERLSVGARVQLVLGFWRSPPITVYHKSIVWRLMMEETQTRTWQCAFNL